MGFGARIPAAYNDSTTLVPTVIPDHTGSDTIGIGLRVWLDVPD